MKNFKKKGFTIVELVIVIAVIAILSAVLIPTFSSLIKKANLSNDKSFVRNANTTLAVEATLDSFESAGDAIDALNRNGFAGKYNTYSKNYHYCISLENAKMYLLDENNDVIFPEENVDKTTLWGLYTNNRTSVVEGITKYIAMTNITNSDHYNDVFVNGTYTIDLNGYFIAVDSTLTNVSANNGIIISGAQSGENVNTDYELIDEELEYTDFNEKYVTNNQNEVITISNTIYQSGLGFHVSTKDIVFENCIFYNEGMNIDDSSGFNNVVKFNNCKFIDIESDWGVLSHGSIEVTNCEFIKMGHGAIQVQENSEDIMVKISNCTFDGLYKDEYPLIRFVGRHNDSETENDIASLEISDCNFISLNKAICVIGFTTGGSGENSCLYNYDSSNSETIVKFVNNKVGNDVTSDKYVKKCGENCKLAELFAASVK